MGKWGSDKCIRPPASVQGCNQISHTAWASQTSTQTPFQSAGWNRYWPCYGGQTKRPKINCFEEEKERVCVNLQGYDRVSTCFYVHILCLESIFMCIVCFWVSFKPEDLTSHFSMNPYSCFLSFCWAQGLFVSYQNENISGMRGLVWLSLFKIWRAIIHGPGKQRVQVSDQECVKS